MNLLCLTLCPIVLLPLRNKETHDYYQIETNLWGYLYAHSGVVLRSLEYGDSYKSGYVFVQFI